MLIILSRVFFSTKKDENGQRFSFCENAGLPMPYSNAKSEHHR